MLWEDTSEGELKSGYGRCFACAVYMDESVGMAETLEFKVIYLT